MKRLTHILIIILLTTSCSMNEEDRFAKIKKLNIVANKHFENLDANEYIKTCEEIISLEPEDIDEYYFDMGLILTLRTSQRIPDSSDYLRAVEMFTQAININPNNESAYFFRGDSYRALNNLDLAIEDYTTSIRLKPYTRGLNAYSARAACKEDLGNYKGAIKDYTSVIDFYDSDKYEAKLDLFWRAKVYLTLGDTINACEDLNIIADSTDAYIRDLNSIPSDGSTPSSGSFYPQANAYDLIKKYCSY